MTPTFHTALIASTVGFLAIGCQPSSPQSHASSNNSAADAQSSANVPPTSRGAGDSPSGDANVVASGGVAQASDRPQAPDAGRVVEATFDDIKFDMEPTESFDPDMLTRDIEALFGKMIRIRGYMLPAMRRKGLRQFVLVRDNQECCFGPGAALYDCILVRMEGDKTTDYSIRPVAVEGVFRFEELKDPVTDRHLAVFQMTGQSVE